QQPSAAPFVDPTRLKTVDRMTFELGILSAEAPRSEQAPRRLDAVQLLDALAGKPHELPAPPAAPAGHQRRRPRRVADLDVERAPDLRLGRKNVDDEPIEEEAQIRDGGAEMRANEAVGAVTTDDETGVASQTMRVARRDLEVHGRGGDVDANHLVRAMHIDARQRAGARIEHALQLGLG